MRVTMKKSGDSAAIHIPAAVMQAAKLPMNAIVEVREEAGRIVIEPVQSTEPDLTTLIDAITPDNLHGELSLGPTMGRESL
ncbi:PbsX family transcriptional regulator [Niveispirillum sp. SYP-B3756]|nr:PbsX family transcriptional regulator [Niveispirillum sp. SYP-B3756]